MRWLKRKIREKKSYWHTVETILQHLEKFKIGLGKHPNLVYQELSHLGLFIITQDWKQPNCPSMGEWLNKVWYGHIMKYYLAIRRNELLVNKTRWMNLKTITLNGSNLTQTHCIILLLNDFSKDNTIGKRKQVNGCQGIEVGVTIKEQDEGVFWDNGTNCSGPWWWWYLKSGPFFLWPLLFHLYFYSLPYTGLFEANYGHLITSQDIFYQQKYL